MAEVDALADNVFKAVESYLARSLTSFEKRLDDLIAAKIAELPVPKDGEPGKDGQAGRDGNDGIAGRDGVDGKDGIAGKDGEIGKEGAPGKDAEVDYKEVSAEIIRAVTLAVDALPVPKDGQPGKDGNPGKDGVPGKDGEAGKDAEIDYAAVGKHLEALVAGLPVPKDGADGKDADLNEVKQFVLEAVALEAEKIVVPKDGKDGQNGKDGNDGKDGRDGPTSFVIDDAGQLVALYADGTTKAIGSVKGSDGASILDGRVDEAGQLLLRLSDERTVNAGSVKGPAGKDGEDGRDAAALEIVTSLDETRSYPRGTFAAYKGGLLRAARPTSALSGKSLEKAGWMIVVDGDQDLEIEQGADLRTFVVRKVKTSGLIIDKKFALPVILDRGVYTPSEAYKPGDAVTWDGSLWVAQKATSQRPGVDTDWRLAVKRGRDGKDNVVRH